MIRLLAIGICAALTFGCEKTEESAPVQVQKAEQPLRIGYFHGGRNVLVYRAWTSGWYDDVGLDIVLRATKQPESKEFFDMPKSADALAAAKKRRKTKYFGRTTGPTIVGEMKKGGLDCGMIGESSFLLVVDEGLPYTAVAKMGQDSREEPGKILVVRSDLDIKRPEDMIGMTIGSRESGPYDMVMTREFILSRGLRLDQLTILDQIPQQPLKDKLKAQELDLAFLHLHIASKMVTRGLYKRYPGFEFDFADPALSQSLLVCKNTVIEDERSRLIQFIETTISRIVYEQALPEAQRRSHQGDKTKGMELRTFKGLNLPQYDPQPYIEVSLLATMQGLLVKHGIISKAKAIVPYVDNSLVEEALKRRGVKNSPK